jgi:hypothetical protein
MYDYDVKMSTECVRPTKKALLVSNNIYYCKSGKDHGYLKPSLLLTLALAIDVYNLRAEPLLPVQFKELVKLVQHGDVSLVEELIDSKDRIITNPSRGISFTPCKKPRFSSSFLDDHLEIDILPSIKEVPTKSEGIQTHMLENWLSTMVQSIEAFKGTITWSQHHRYDVEIMSMSNNVEQLHTLSSRLNTQVRKPTKGIQFDLIGIVDKVEGCILDLLKDLLSVELRPGLLKATANSEAALTESTMVIAGLGGDVIQKLQNLKSSVQAWEATAKASVTDIPMAHGKLSSSRKCSLP